MEKMINGVLLTRDSVVDVHKGLVFREANKLRTRGITLGLDMDDLKSIGFIGLIKAFDKFDYEKFPVRFSTYAVPMIWGELQRVLRDSNMGVKYSRSIKDIGWNIRRYELEELSVEDIALNLMVSVPNVVHALDFLKYGVPASLDKPLDSTDGTETTISDITGAHDDITEMFVQEFLDTLTPREREVVEGRMMDMNQTDLGEKVGVSQVQVSRILTKVGKKYIEYLNSSTEGEYSKESITNPKEIKSVSMRLPSDEKVVFTREDVDRLREEGLTYAEVARELGVSLPTLTNRRNEWKELEKPMIKVVEKKVPMDDLEKMHNLRVRLHEAKDTISAQEVTIQDQSKYIQELEEKCRFLESKVSIDLITNSGRELVLMLVEREQERKEAN